MKKLVFVVSTVVTIVLALDKVGGRPIAPGRETNFRVQERLGELELAADAGDIVCCVDLIATGVDASAPTFLARLDHGDALEVRANRLGPSAWSLRVMKSKEPGATSDEKLTWPAGQSMRISVPRCANAPRITDWAVYLASDESDTLAKARWRTQWFWISLFALCVSVPAALYTGWPRVARERGDPARRCVEEIVDGIEGVDEHDTERLRIVLRKVCIDGAAHAEALDAARVHGARQP